MPENDQYLRIHIDRISQDSPNPTTGAALYKLGNIGHHQLLFREVDGDKEDVQIANDDERIHLKQDEHFYSAQDITIIVNGRPKVVTQHRLSFDQVVVLAFDTPPSGANIMFTITYRNGPPKNPEGSLLEGGSVRIKDQMIFNVTSTDKS